MNDEVVEAGMGCTGWEGDEGSGRECTDCCGGSELVEYLADDADTVFLVVHTPTIIHLVGPRMSLYAL